MEAQCKILGRMKEANKKEEEAKENEPKENEPKENEPKEKEAKETGAAWFSFDVAGDATVVGGRKQLRFIPGKTGSVGYNDQTVRVMGIDDGHAGEHVLCFGWTGMVYEYGYNAVAIQVADKMFKSQEICPSKDTCVTVVLSGGKGTIYTEEMHPKKKENRKRKFEVYNGWVLTDKTPCPTFEEVSTTEVWATSFELEKGLPSVSIHMSDCLENCIEILDPRRSEAYKHARSGLSHPVIYF